MDSPKTPPSETRGSLVDRLSNGWRNTNSDVISLVYGIAGVLGVDPKGINSLNNGIRFDVDLTGIQLAGMDDVKCIILGGDGSDTVDLISSFWQSAGGAGRIAFVFCTNGAVYSQVTSTVPRGRALILTAANICEILTSKTPRKYLVERLRHAIPLRRLVPFRSQGPIWNHMFRGRLNELDRLKQEENVSFVIAGPSRVGKSSLVKRYKEYELRKDRDPRMHSCFYIDLYGHTNLDNDGIAQLIALRMDNSLKNSRMTASRLSNLLRFLKGHFGRAVELILDEVDPHVGKNVFQLLGQAAREGLCRLILVGRGELAKMTLNQSSPFACRMEWIKLGGISNEQCDELFLGPFSDLGYECSEPTRVAESIRNWTGRLPHLIQFYGYHVAEHLIETTKQPKIIDEEMVARIRDNEQTVAYVMSPLDDLSSTARQIAIETLRQAPPKITLPKMKQIALDIKIELQDEELLQLCTEFVICNILAWEDRSYRLASEALPGYARDLGLFDKPRAAFAMGR